ncbi:uncharacterized protein TRAVEDRAFT_130797, partial [Trametes versicolor FP-101664 SS1]|uniref:uncharacterized protein n=1 Tax=Trametes versicolor (strain FP-101664) TaxID=717944 RepID=UPI00046242F6
MTTHTFFEIVRAVLDRHTEALSAPGSDRDRTARAIIVKIVNAMTGASEIGGPAVCAQLLGNPDHYTNETFKVFYWYAYVQYVRKLHNADAPVHSDDPERLLLVQTEDGVVGHSKLSDYVHRPPYFALWSLYDFLRLTDIRKLREKDSSSSDQDEEENAPRSPASPRAHRFTAPHPLHKSHGVYLRSESSSYVLNFVGRALPRPDKGDREEYALTMLVLFYPSGWRHASDLRGTSSSWFASFEQAHFTDRSLAVMKHMNVLYECLDARDDFAA